MWKGAAETVQCMQVYNVLLNLYCRDRAFVSRQLAIPGPNFNFQYLRLRIMGNSFRELLSLREDNARLDVSAI